jgi:hypothetical protein
MKKWLVLMLLVTIVCCAVLCPLKAFSADVMNLPYDQITINGNSISIVGHNTEKQNQASYENYMAHNEKYRKQVEAEIKRKHHLEVEIAKFNNAILLESAGAPRIYVSSWSSNYNQSQNQALNGSHNKTKQNADRN